MTVRGMTMIYWQLPVGARFRQYHETAGMPLWTKTGLAEAVQDETDVTLILSPNTTVFHVTEGY